jgi:hypothetical protein
VQVQPEQPRVLLAAPSAVASGSAAGTLRYDAVFRVGTIDRPL